MKKLVIAVILSILGSVAALAQEPAAPWTWQLQTGYSTSTKTMDSGWSGATSIGYQFTDTQASAHDA